MEDVQSRSTKLVNDVSECEANTEINQLKRWHQSMAVSSTESTQENEDHSRAGTPKRELSELNKWHIRYGHLNEKNLKLLLNQNLVKGMSVKSDDKLSTCKTCIMGKQTAKTFPKVSDSKSENLLDLVHSDVCGPMRTKSLGGASSHLLMTSPTG